MNSGVTQFEDAESHNYGFNKDSLTFKDIILHHVKKISSLASVEFRGGYWETRPDPRPGSNMEIKVYVPDTREVYSNAVECLADMLAPYFDSAMKEAESVAIKEDEEAYKAHTNESQEDKRGFQDIKERVEYRDKRVKVNRRLFRALCCFLYRKRYLDLGVLED